jgi:hypothetical protein
MREEYLRQNLVNGELTIDLYKQYKKHLGAARYQLLKQAQLLVVPPLVRKHLPLDKVPWLMSIIWSYQFLKLLKVETFLRNALLPAAYKAQIISMDKPFVV